MVDSRWSMVDGRWSSVDSRQSSVDSQQSTIVSRQSTIGTAADRRWPIDDRRWPIDDRRWPIDDRRWPIDDRRWPIDDRRWTSLDLPHQLFRFRRIRLEDDRALEFAARAGTIFGLDVSAGQCHPRRSRFLAPNRNLERVDCRRCLSGSQVDAAKQQLCLGFIWRKIQRAAKLGDSFRVAALLEKPSATIEMEGGQFALLALSGIRDQVADALNSRCFQAFLDALQAAGNR